MNSNTTKHITNTTQHRETSLSSRLDAHEATLRESQQLPQFVRVCLNSHHSDIQITAQKSHSRKMTKVKLIDIQAGKKTNSRAICGPWTTPRYNMRGHTPQCLRVLSLYVPLSRWQGPRPYAARDILSSIVPLLATCVRSHTHGSRNCTP